MKQKLKSRTVELAFGKIVKNLREQKGLSRKELADIVDSYPQHLLKIERGLNSPSMYLVFKFAYSLGLTPVELIQLLENDLVEQQAAGPSP